MLLGESRRALALPEQPGKSSQGRKYLWCTLKNEELLPKGEGSSRGRTIVTKEVIVYVHASMPVYCGCTYMTQWLCECV